MKVLVVSLNFAPEQTGIGKYSGEMVAWLVGQGHSVRVIAAPPYYPEWKVRRNYRWPPYQRERWRGADVWRAPLWVPKCPSGLKRVLHLLSFAVTSAPAILTQLLWRPDLVISVAPAFVYAPTALLVARLSGAQSWLHVQDFEVDLAFRMNLLKGNTLQNVIARLETWVMRRFDLVSTISQRMVERLIQKGVAQHRIRYFPNWVDTSRIKPSSTTGAFRAQLGISPDALVVLFSGTLSDKQGPMAIPAAASLLAARPDIVFVICGDGVLKAQVQAASKDLPNVLLIPLQPVERLSELLGMADIHLLPQCVDAADLVLPSKLSGMLASGRPVIATCLKDSELGEVVAKCGMVVPPEDQEALVRSICRLADDRGLRIELGRRARGYAEANFDLEAVLGAMFSPLESHDPLVGDAAA